MAEEAEVKGFPLPKLFNGPPWRVELSGTVHVHFHVHFDDQATLAKLAAELKAKTDEAKAAVDAAPHSVPPPT